MFIEFSRDGEKISFNREHIEAFRKYRCEGDKTVMFIGVGNSTKEEIVDQSYEEVKAIMANRD